MKITHARIIIELAANAGYLDDADELIADRLKEDGEEKTREFCEQFDELLSQVNSVLPLYEQKVSSLVDELNSQVKS